MTIREWIRRKIDPLRCRYSDCVNRHPVALTTRDNEDPEDTGPFCERSDQEERVTCETCRADMGLPTIAEDEASN